MTKNQLEFAELALNATVYSTNSFSSKWYDLLNKEELRSDVKMEKAGISRVYEHDSDAIEVEFDFPFRKETKVLEEGIVCQKGILTLGTSYLILVNGHMFVFGNTLAVKYARDIVSPIVGASASPVDISDKALYSIADKALSIKKVKIKDIPNGGIKNVVVSGNMEDGVDATLTWFTSEHCSLDSVQGVFNSPQGPRVLVFSKKGKISIKKTKKKDPLTVETLNWFTKAFL